MDELTTKVCPYCGEMIKAHRVKCNFCDMRLDKENDLKEPVHFDRGQQGTAIIEETIIEENKYVDALETQAAMFQILSVVGGLFLVIWGFVERMWILFFIGAIFFFICLIYANLIYAFCGLVNDISDIKRILKR